MSMLGITFDKFKENTGGVSPFMFGLLIGMGVFSMLSLQYAQKELLAQRARNAARDHAKAEDIAKAMEFSMLTETRATYSDDMNLRRALGNTSSADGKTRGGDNVLVVERDAGEGEFGSRDKRIAITATDDTLYRSKIYRSGDAQELSRMQGVNTPGQPANTREVVTFDSSIVRDRQVRTSVQNMNVLAEHIYSFFAGHMRFPTGTEVDEIQHATGLKDVWGGDFSYNKSSDDQATLEFTTPWNYTRSLNLSLKDDNNGAAPDDPQRNTATASADPSSTRAATQDDNQGNNKNKTVSKTTL